MKILILVPAYNEEENIFNTIQDIIFKAPDVGYIVINDCSKDGTKAVLKENNIPYLDLPINLGIGGGVQAGYLYAMEHDYDIAIQFDGDGQHDASYVSQMIDYIAKEDYNMVIGSRFVEKTKYKQTFFTPQISTIYYQQSTNQY